MTGRGYFDPYGVPLRAPCPACPGRVPMKHQANRLVCPRCRGELLDRHDATVLLSKFALPPLPERDPARQRTRACGLCGGPMASHRVQSGQTVEICATCSGLFLELGEARLVHEAASSRSGPSAAAPASQPLTGIPRREPAPDAAPSALAGALGVVRLLFRLSPVLLLVAAGWHFRDTGRRAFETFRFGPSTWSARTDLSSARTAVAAELASDRWPSDLSALLRESLQSPTAHLDRWGTPYELRGSPKEPVLASCGPDKACGNDDDLLVPVFRERSAAGPDPGVDRYLRD